jgi:RNA-binding protein
LELTDLRRLGTVLHISNRGSIIVRTEKAPSIGSTSIVFDKRAQEIGSVSDVFGPVKNPYVAIRPMKDLDPKKLVGHVLYMHKK